MCRVIIRSERECEGLARVMMRDFGIGRGDRENERIGTARVRVG
jgi:hypothetical protein